MECPLKYSVGRRRNSFGPGQAGPGHTRPVGRANQAQINELEVESIPCLMPFLISAWIILLQHSLIVRAPLKITQLKVAVARSDERMTHSFFLIASARFVTKPAMPLMPKSCRDSGVEVSWCFVCTSPAAAVMLSTSRPSPRHANLRWDEKVDTAMMFPGTTRVQCGWALDAPTIVPRCLTLLARNTCHHVAINSHTHTAHWQDSGVVEVFYHPTHKVCLITVLSRIPQWIKQCLYNSPRNRMTYTASCYNQLLTNCHTVIRYLSYLIL